jgi:hypothetical protein
MVATNQMAVRRGYMAIRVRERGNTPRGMKRAFNNASKRAWLDTARYFHEHLRDKRFTPEHAREAGYYARKGQNLPRGSKQFKRSYYGRKLLSQRGGGWGKANPLEWTGDTRRAIRSGSASSTSKGGKMAYAGARVFNYRPPKSQIRMNEEFRRITPDEAIELANYYDRQLDDYLKKEDGA